MALIDRRPWCVGSWATSVCPASCPNRGRRGAAAATGRVRSVPGGSRIRRSAVTASPVRGEGLRLWAGLSPTGPFVLAIPDLFNDNRAQRAVSYAL